MIKSELVERLAAEYPDLKKRDVERVVSTVLETIVGALERGQRTELRHFGAFTVRPLKAREGRDPRNGKTFALPPRVAIRFRMGKRLRSRLSALSKPSERLVQDEGEGAGQR